MSRPLVPGLVAEGETDEHFLGAVISRQLRALTDLSPRPVDVQSVQYAACRMTKDDSRIGQAVEELADDCHLIFLHSDHRERGKADRLTTYLAGKGVTRPLIPLVPVKETESWLLADAAVWDRVPGADTSLAPRKPKDAEKVADPKAVLKAMLTGIAYREVNEYLAFAGDQVDLAVLARLPAYREWVDATTEALGSRGFL
ncbi:DUF4276 family protein [Nonomuraea sp. NPDC049750]|uniref:DUF4276 family protein n=1 Tax=Nonomuraea sp. NPDC049750 TaxID=3154738 RepID=UPI0033F3CB24